MSVEVPSSLLPLFLVCPPDLQGEAVQTVLLQAETLCKDWVA